MVIMTNIIIMDFDQDFVKQIRDWLNTSLQYVPELFVPEAFEEYLLCRDVIYDEYTRMITDEYGQIKDEMEGYSIAERLHDIPMLQIISNINIFRIISMHMRSYLLQLMWSFLK